MSDSPERPPGWLARINSWLAARGFDRRSRVAMFMALVALVGAMTTFQASKDDLIASDCDRRVDEAQIVVLAYRQNTLAKGLAYAGWADQIHIHRMRAARLLQMSDDLRAGRAGTGGLSANALDVEAQLENAVARELQPLADFTLVDVGKSESIDTAIGRYADDELGTLHLSKHCQNVPPPSPIAGVRPAAATAGFADTLRQDANMAQTGSVREAAVVVLFVLILATLTLSEISTGKAKNAFEIAGYVLFAAGVLAAVLWADTTLLLLLAAIVGLYIIAACAAWAIVSRLHWHAAETDEELPHVHELDPWFKARESHFVVVHDAFGKLVVLLIAVAALLSAGSGFFYGDAVANAHEATAEAARAQTDVLDANALYSQTAMYHIGLLAQLWEARTRAAAFTSIEQSGLLRLRPATRASWEEQKAIWQSVQDHLVEGSSHSVYTMRLDGDLGPFGDPRFPRAYYADQTIRYANAGYGRWNGNETLAAAWSQKSSLYLATLTIFAIALYLFGQSLGMGKSRGAAILTIFGTLLLFAGLTVGGITLARPVPNIGALVAVPAECRDAGDKAPPAQTRADAAGLCYSYGDYLDYIADRPAQYDAAVRAYRAAAILLPGFALARDRVSAAETDAATPQRHGDTSVVSMARLEQIAADDGSMVDDFKSRGLDAASAYWGLGFDSYMLALTRADRGLLERSQRATNRALALDPSNDAVRYNAAVARLALGDAQGGLRIYRDHMADTGSADGVVASGAITDLEIFRSKCPSLPWLGAAYCAALNPQIDAIKASFVQRAWDDRSQAVAGIFDGRMLATKVSPSDLGWSVPYAPSKSTHVVTQVWYQWDPQWRAWYVLPNYSGQFDVHADRSTAYVQWSHLMGQSYRECQQVSQPLRLELYVDGRLAGMRTASPIGDVSPGEYFNAAAIREAGSALCYPDGWQHQYLKTGRLAAGYMSTDRRRGVYLFSFTYPRVPARERAADLEAFIAYAIRLQAPQGVVLRRTVTPCRNYVGWWNAEPPDALYRQYVTNFTAIAAKAWTGADGLVHVAYVWHPLLPNARFGGTPPDEPLSCRVLASVTPIE